MAPKRLRRAIGAAPVVDPPDKEPQSPSVVDVNALVRAPNVQQQTVERPRRGPRTFASKIIISNALCNDEGVQIPSKVIALSIVATLPSKNDCLRFNNICKHGIDTTDKLPKDQAGLLFMNDLLLSGNMFFEFSWQTGKTYLYGLNVDRGANQTLCISIEHAAMVCDILLPLLRTAGVG